MCGIVGILARQGSVPEQLLERATRSLAHRGPDDQGTVILREEHPEALELGLGILEQVQAHAKKFGLSGLS